MKKTKIMAGVLALAISVGFAIAQETKDAPPRGQGQGQGRPEGRGGPQGGPGGEGQRPMMIPPIIAALDSNGDGVIDEVEINQATASLRKLDKNGDGKLTMDELMPRRPQGGQGGEGRGQGGPGGPGGQNKTQKTRPPGE